MKYTMKKGFTLIELMIVIVILGVLTVTALTNFRSVQIKSRDARRKNNLRQIATALEYYYNDYGSYPPDTSNKIYGCGTTGLLVCDWGSPFQTVLASGLPKTIYMPKLPGDPSSGRYYYYDRIGTSSYKLYAMLENSADSENVPVATVNCGAGDCNYVITSSNTTP